MRRLLAVAAGALGLLVLAAAPASAAFTQASWTAPAGVSPPAAGSDDWSATVDRRATPQQVNLAGVFEHPDGVASVQLVLERSEYTESEPRCAPQGFGQTAPGAPEGPTTFSFDVLLPCNGLYVVRANATSRGALGRSPETSVLRLALRVAVPAVPVQSVVAEPTSTEPPEVAVRWEPVGEADRDPDFAGYDIERAVDDGPFEVLASLPDPEAAAYLDKRPDEAGGTHRYRVVSLRRAGATSSAGVVAAPDTAAVAAADLPRTEPEDETDEEIDDGATTGAGTSRATRPRSSVRRAAPAASSGGTVRRTITTTDTGFDETLPFDAPAGDDQQAMPAGDPAVVARIEDESGAATTKQTLALLAGGSAMAVGALTLRRVLRQASSPYEILQ